jgi:hypothetical protein
MKRKPNPILLPVIERLERNLENLSFYCSPGFMPPRDGVAINNLVAHIMRGVSGSRELGYWPSHELLQQIQDDVTVLAERGRVRQIYPVWKAFEQVDRRLTKLRLKLRVGNLISRARAMLPAESELNKVVRLAIAGDIQARCSLGDMIMKTEKLAELLQADQQMERQRCWAKPVAEWTVRIEHPMAKDFVCIAGFDPPGQECATFTGAFCNGTGCDATV